MREHWTDEKLNWIRKNKSNFSSREEIKNAFNKQFATNVSFQKFTNACKKHSISLRYESILWADKIEWLNDNKYKYTDREDILNDMNKHFNINFDFAKIKDMNTKYKLNLPLAHRRINQGLENGRIKLRGFSKHEIGETCYRSGDNYFVKTDITSNHKKNFTLKHRYLYEKYHNVKLEHDDFIIFLDDDTNNFSKENLYRIPRKVHDLMSGHRLHNYKDKSSVVKFCEWKLKLKELSKGE